jgi:hypothetical protein
MLAVCWPSPSNQVQTTRGVHVGIIIIITPRALMHSRDKAIGLCVCRLSSVVSTKIARSGHLGVSAIREYN